MSYFLILIYYLSFRYGQLSEFGVTRKNRNKDRKGRRPDSDDYETDEFEGPKDDYGDDFEGGEIESMTILLEYLYFYCT